MNKSWYKLKIDTSNALINPWPLIPKIPNYGIWIQPKESIFNKEWMDYVESLGLALSSRSMVFYRGPNWNTQYAHLDVEVYKDSENEIPLVCYGVNWVLKGEDSSMVWYDMPDKKYEVLYTEAKTPYINFKIETLNEIDRCNIQLEPVLVRVDIPHSISVGNEERWCISARFKKHIRNMSWDSVVELFRSKNLLIER
jgi:hypothetical protein